MNNYRIVLIGSQFVFSNGTFQRVLNALLSEERVEERCPFFVMMALQCCGETQTISEAIVKPSGIGSSADVVCFIYYQKNWGFDYGQLFLHIFISKCSICANETEETLFWTQLLIAYSSSQAFLPVLLWRTAISNDRLHIKPNNILHPLIHQMLIRANNNNSQIIIQILREFGNCTKTGKGFSCACCHIKDSTIAFTNPSSYCFLLIRMEFYILRCSCPESIIIYWLSMTFPNSIAMISELNIINREVRGILFIFFNQGICHLGEFKNMDVRFTVSPD